MLCAQRGWARFLKQYPATGVGSHYCSKRNHGSKTGNSTGDSENGGENGSSLSSYNETYQKLHNLDFTTAANILFAKPAKKKRFGCVFFSPYTGFFANY